MVAYEQAASHAATRFAAAGCTLFVLGTQISLYAVPLGEFRRPILGRLVVKGVARFSLAAIGEWFRRKAVVQLTPTVKTD